MVDRQPVVVYDFMVNYRIVLCTRNDHKPYEDL